MVVTLLEETDRSALLRIGVTRSGLGQLEAHAWVESEGKVIIGNDHGELARYTLLRAVEGA